jgi:dihydrofolate reductase
MSKRIVLVVAHSRDRAIGRAGDLPWRLPADLAHFKAETLGSTLVMGRATWDSIGRPLPGRETVVVTRDPEWTAGAYADQVRVAHSVTEALAVAAALPGDVMVAGGGQVYAAALPFATHLVVTEVDTRVHDADAFFPEIDLDEWPETRRVDGEGLSWVWRERRR